MKTGGAFALLLALVASCSSKQPAELPPLGEVVIAVDTDLPLAFAERLRVDVLEGGVWIESRDLVRPSADSWPASFSVFSPDPDSERVATVRLRVYPEGRTRDYHGERFAPRSTAVFGPADRAAVTGDDTPRLIRDGVDVTPTHEPIPLATVDRLVRVRVTPGRRELVQIVLHGECLGTMADVANDLTCIDTDAALVPVVDEPVSELGALSPSVVRTFPGYLPCTIAPRDERHDADGASFREEEACVPGGLFFFGVPYAQGLIDDEGVGIPAVLSPFLIDKWEVTVGRYRRAVARGFKPKSGGPLVNDAPFFPRSTGDTDESFDLCTYSSTPIGREDYPVTCVPLTTARAFCQFDGGDLPTEAQWYYAAVVVDRPAQTPYPWGEDIVDCDRAVVSRVSSDTGYCLFKGLGPAPVDAAPTDLSISLGLVGMHGNVAEWTLDTYHHLYEGCWYTATLHDPSCNDPAGRLQAVGGVSWRQPSFPHDHRQSWSKVLRTNHVGFRCVRGAAASE